MAKSFKWKQTVYQVVKMLNEFRLKRNNNEGARVNIH